MSLHEWFMVGMLAANLLATVIGLFRLAMLFEHRMTQVETKTDMHERNISRLFTLHDNNV